MEELITTFHIDWKLLVAQLVNFIIVLIVLWKFALKPLMKIMHERTSTVERSLKQAVEIEKKLAETEENARQRILDVQKQATAILHQASKQAEEKKQHMLEKTKQEAEKVITRAKEQIREERDAAIRGAHDELANLVSVGIERVLDKAIDEKFDGKIIKQQLQHLKK